MLLSNLNLLVTAPGGVARLRELILTLAVQGKLLPQNPQDEPASVLLKKIRAEKDRLIAEGKIKRDKPLAAVAEDEKPFEVPRGWEWVRLGSLANFIDYRGKTPTKTSAGIPLITAKNVRQGFINREPREFIAESAYVGWMTRGFPKVGDLLFTTEAPLGNVAVIDIAERFALAQRVICFGLYELGMSGTLATFLRSAWMQSALSDKATGVTAQGIKSARLQVMPVPPLAEQSRIVTRVEELMRLCDALEAKGQLAAAQHARLVSTLLGTLTDSATPDALAENWQRIASHFDLLLDRPQAVDALEQTILQLAVRGLLAPQDPQDEPASALLQKIRQEKDRLIAQGQIKRDKPLPPIAENEQPFALPHGWEWVRVGSIGITQTGGTPASSNPEYFDGNFPFIGPGQITPDGQILPAEKFISERGRLESAVAEPGDILMVCIGGSIGKCAAASFATAFNQQINCIHPVLASGAYVLNAMASSDFVSAVLSTATGSATPIISKGKWDLLLLPLPPLAEQSRIVTRVAQLRRLCADLRQRLAASQSTQAHLAEALVSTVGSGLPVA